MSRTVFHNTDLNQRDKSNTPVNVAQIPRYSGLYLLAFILLHMVTFKVLLEGLSTLPLFTISSTLSHMRNYAIRSLATFIFPVPLFTSRVSPPCT